MADDKKAAAAATVTAPITQANVEKEVGYIGARLREKSTYGGLAVALGVLAGFAHSYFPRIGGINPDTLAAAIEYLGLAVGTFIGIFLPEKGSQNGKPVNPLGMGAFLFFLAGTWMIDFPAHAMWPDFAPAQAHAQPVAKQKIARRATHVVHVAQASTSSAPASTPKAPNGKLTVTQVNQNPILLLQQFSVTDLQNAINLATTNNDQTSLPCWQKLLSIVQTLNGTVSSSLGTSGSSTTGSAFTPGIATALQDARDAQSLITNMQAANGPLAQLNIACAPLVVSTQNTLIQLGVLTGAIVGTAASGGLTLLPGIALPALAVPKL